MCQRKELLPPPPHPPKKHILIEFTVDWHNINHWNKGSDFQLNTTHTRSEVRTENSLEKVMEDKLFFNAAPNMPWGIIRCCIFYILLCHIVSATSLHTVKSSNMAVFTLDTSSRENMGVIFCHGIKKRIIIMQLLPCRSRAPKRIWTTWF